jgi:hypothetical protein
MTRISCHYNQGVKSGSYKTTCVPIFECNKWQKILSFQPRCNNIFCLYVTQNVCLSEINDKKIMSLQPRCKNWGL